MQYTSATIKQCYYTIYLLTLLHNTLRSPSTPLEPLEHALSRKSNEMHRMPVHIQGPQCKHLEDSTVECLGLYAARNEQYNKYMHSPYRMLQVKWQHCTHFHLVHAVWVG